MEWASSGLGAVFAQRGNLLRPSFLRMLREVVRFNREARRLLDLDGEKVTLGDYLCGAGHSADFVERYVVPMGAAIWFAPPAELLRFPATSLVRFFHNHGLLDRRDPIAWRVIVGGSRRYVEALVAPFRQRIRTSGPVRAVRRVADGVEVVSESRAERFDGVILAVHSDPALRLLPDASDAERHVLGRIRALGLPPRFLRMWEYYLCYCGAGFRERAIGAIQVLLEKPLARRAPLLGELA